MLRNHVEGEIHHVLDFHFHFKNCSGKEAAVWSKETVCMESDSDDSFLSKESRELDGDADCEPTDTDTGTEHEDEDDSEHIWPFLDKCGNFDESKAIPPEDVDVSSLSANFDEVMSEEVGDIMCNGVEPSSPTGVFMSEKVVAKTLRRLAKEKHKKDEVTGWKEHGIGFDVTHATAEVLRFFEKGFSYVPLSLRSDRDFEDVEKWTSFLLNDTEGGMKGHLLGRTDCFRCPDCLAGQRQRAVGDPLRKHPVVNLQGSSQLPALQSPCEQLAKRWVQGTGLARCAGQ